MGNARIGGNPLQSIDGTWILAFALKVRKSKSFSFNFDKVVEMAVDLGIKPVGFLGVSNSPVCLTQDFSFVHV